MRGTMDGDVPAERQLIAVERLLARMPRSRGFRVSADGTVSVYPALSCARRRPDAKQEGSPKSKREPRSEQAGGKRAANARTRRSAARAAKHRRRKAWAGGTSPAAARLQNGEGAALAARIGRLDRLDAGPAGLRPRPQLSPCSGPRRATAAGAQQPRRVHALSLLSGEAHAPHAGLPSLPDACHPPERAQDEKACWP